MNKRMNSSAQVDRTLFRDLMASLVVFLVALPLCMGIALASGAPVAAGLVTGIIGGIVVGCLAGSPLQVSGPAAGLTVVCGEVIREHGMPALGVVVLLAGLVQLAAGFFRLGQWFRAVSPAVVHGMLSGIGVLILSSQLHVMVDDRPRHSGLANILSAPEAIRKGLPMPKAEDTATKQSRRELLQAVGRLHERQTEIALHVGRYASPSHPPHPPHETRADETKLLASFVPLQKAIVADFGQFGQSAPAQQAEPSPSEAKVSLPAAMGPARRALEAALSDLKAGSIDKAAASQNQATDALADVLAGLKSHDWAAKVGLVSIAVIVLWQMLAPARLKFIPGPLLAVVATTLLAWVGALPVLYVEVPDRLVDGLTFPTLQVFQDMPIAALATAVLTMAVIASAETLLCATAVDRMHTGERTQYDRELMAQGLGNFLCGFAGALPMTGVIVRSAANVQAGARSRLSAILHGLWLLLFVLVLAGLLRQIPTAALAGILVYTGFRLIDFRGLANLWKTDRVEALIFIATVTLIVVEDLLIGVVTGLVLSAVKLLWTFSRLEVRTMSDRSGELTVRVVGAATFLRLPVLAARLEEIPEDVPVTIDVARLSYLDQACYDLIVNWARQRRLGGAAVRLDRERLETLLRGRAPNAAPAAPEAIAVADERAPEPAEMAR
jgi:MFS superfamily sulfate permease-like transporter